MKRVKDRYPYKSKKISSNNNRQRRVRNKKILVIGIAVGVVVISAILSIALPRIGITPSNNNNNQNKGNLFFLNELLNPTYSSASALGSSNAKVTMIEFGDYQCQYCKRFHSETKDSIIKNFVNTGQVRFLFKDFTINDKPEDKASTLAADASYCAADQGKYWQYYDEVYKNSKGENIKWINTDMLKQFAKNVNVSDIQKFSDCLQSHKHEDIVNKNNNLANSIGLQATPTFLLLSTTDNTLQQQKPIAIVGAQPYSAFEQTIAKIKSSVSAT